MSTRSVTLTEPERHTCGAIRPRISSGPDVFCLSRRGNTFDLYITLLVYPPCQQRQPWRGDFEGSKTLLDLQSHGHAPQRAVASYLRLRQESQQRGNNHGALAEEAESLKRSSTETLIRTSMSYRLSKARGRVILFTS